MTLSCKWPINTKNERNNASQLDCSFFPTLGFPTRIHIQIDLPVHTYPTHIRIISITQDSSGNIGNWACVKVAILNTIFTVQLTLAYPDLASTRFRIHIKQKFPFWWADSKSCGFVCRIHRIRVDESQIQRWITHKPHSNNTRTLWGRADTRHVSFWISCFYNGIVYSFFFWNYKSLLCWLNLLVDKY